MNLRDIAAALGCRMEGGDPDFDISGVAAMERARERAGKDSVIVITGSIYLVGEAMSLFGVTA